MSGRTGFLAALLVAAGVAVGAKFGEQISAAASAVRGKTGEILDEAKTRIDAKLAEAKAEEEVTEEAPGNPEPTVQA